MNETRTQSPRAAAPMAPYMALAGIWLLTLFIVPPRGDFPLNDDWMYAKVVQHLVETGEYQATPYADPTFILQAYWGAAFAKIFGFSFETLRLSTLVLGLIAVWAAHWAAREAGLSTRWAFLVALTLLVNPLFLNLSYTFMTDVPFLAATTLSIAAFLRAQRTSSLRWLAAASTLAATGYFVRQFALLIPVAFITTLGLSYFTEKNMRAADRKRIVYATATLMAPWFVALFLMKILPLGGESLGMWNWDDLGHTVVRRAMSVFKFLVASAAYLGLFITPVVFSGMQLAKDSPRGDRLLRILLPLSTFFVILAAPMVTDHFLRLPNMGNVLYNTGVGPLLLPGMVEGDRIEAPFQIRQLWIVATAVGLCSVTFMAWIALVTLAQFPIRRGAILSKISTTDFFLVLLAAAFVTILILPAIQARFDRYLLSALVPIAIVCAHAIARFAKRDLSRTFAFIGAAALYIFSVFSLQDYLAWNAARWNALAALQRDHGAQMEQINGGYEFNGWFHSDHYVEESIRTGKKVFGPKGWWIRGDEYRVSLRPNEHFEVIGTEPYFSWLGFTKREILLLKRTQPDTNSALFD